MHTFDAGCGRLGTIEVKDAETCSVCHRETRCLVIDSSEEEYKPGAVCQGCIETMFLAPNAETKEQSS